MYKIILICLFLFGCGSEVIHSHPKYQYSHPNLTRNVFSFDLMEKALAQDKLMLVYIHNKYCNFSRDMEYTLFDTKVIETINKHFLFADMDVTENIIAFDVFKEVFDIHGNPTTLIMTVKKEYDWPMAEIVGYQNPTQYIKNLEYIHGKLDPAISSEKIIIGDQDGKYCAK